MDVTETAKDARGKLLQRVRSVGLLTFLSRILGLIRDSVMAMQFGNGMILDAFSVAFRLPNLARQLFGEGALSTAFLPVFIRDIEQHGKPTAFQTATALVIALSAVLFGLVLGAEIILLVIWWLVPLSAEATLLIGLTATLIPYLMLVCLLAQICAVMHGLGEFSMPALFPVLLNALWILAATFWASTIENDYNRIYAISASIIGIGIVQLSLSLVTLKRLKFEFRWDWIASKTRVREIATTMIPVVIGLSITQFNTLLDSLIAWGLTQPANPETTGWLTEFPLTDGTASALYLGQRMYQFPLGVFGVALGTVIFPLLARHAERQDFSLFRDDLLKGLRLVVAIGVPASAGLFIIATPLTETLFERGQFDANDTLQTAGIITMYAIGVWAACGLLILHRAFYALGDRRTPLRIGLATVALNLTLNLSLVWSFKGQGLAFATAFSAMFQCSVAWVILKPRLKAGGDGRLLQTTGMTLIASAAMIAACVLIKPYVSELKSVWQLLVIVAAGGTTYLAIARLSGLSEPFDLLHRK
jgi:putative peptidoglycan lipid II flippase